MSLSKEQIANRTQELKAKRNKAIFNDCCELYGQGYRVDIIYKMLGDKYYLDGKTISRIIAKERV